MNPHSGFLPEAGLLFQLLVRHGRACICPNSMKIQQELTAWNYVPASPICQKI
jgi:hypothetical protein